MIFVNWLFEQMQAVFSKLNEYGFDGAPIGIILVGFMITSIIISVFWRGGRG